jgi:hypothetical protein
MDALVPARTSGTPFATLARYGAPRTVDCLVSPQRLSAKRGRRPAPFQKSRWSGSARLLARRKPSRRQDEHPP